MNIPGCEISEVGGVTVAKLEGDIDLLLVPAIRSHLQIRAHQAKFGLAVDLSRVRYLDSAGIHMLFQITRELAMARKAVALSVPEGSDIRKLLAITSFGDVASIHSSIEQCIETLSAGDVADY